jgi:hypothetical protein
MDLVWLGLVVVLVVATLGLVALCDPPKAGRR